MDFRRDDRNRWITATALGLAGLNCAFQILWFWRFAHRNINYDAISYIGIARHISEGNFAAALHGYWSPLLSWVVAAASIPFSNFTLVGRLVTVGSFLACLPLLYLLTLKLWKSPLLAAVAVLWFTTARGIVALSVSFIGADFLLTALVLVYFIWLLKCLRQPSAGNCLVLGLAHGAAFLTKAFAMPWLAATTLLASFLMRRHDLRRALLYAFAGMAIPFVVWLSWGMTLKNRYGVFTVGYQAKWNLLDSHTQEQGERQEGAVLYDTSRSYDSYMVADNMFPGSPLWQVRVPFRETTRLILSKERRNLPAAIKQVVILLTPGGVLALFLAFLFLAGDRQTAQREFAGIVLVSSVALLGGYCMLVFDSRYVLPLVPLLIAIAVPFVVKDVSGLEVFARVRVWAGVLLIASTLFLQAYWASPFRTWHRDYELSCYDAAQKLRALPSCQKLAVLGRGPYPEHGVGWEAGLYASYFAGCRMVAFSPDLPTSDNLDGTRAELRSLAPDAILVFGQKGDLVYESLSSGMQGVLPEVVSQEILDPQAGQVGELLWRQTDRSLLMVDERRHPLAHDRQALMESKRLRPQSNRSSPP